MLGKPILRAALFFAFALPLCVSAAKAENAERLPDWVVKLHHPFQPPPEGVVPDARTAIAIAYHVWVPIILKAHSGYHDAEGWKGPNEEYWQANMVAHLDHGVWTVTEPDKPDTLGGAIFIFIAQKDGRVLDVLETQ